MKKYLFLALLLVMSALVSGVSFTDVQSVDVDIGIEQAYLTQDACDLTVVTILTFEVNEVALPNLYRTTFTENVISRLEIHALPNLNIERRVIATTSAATSLHNWQNQTVMNTMITHLRGPSSLSPGVI